MSPDEMVRQMSPAFLFMAFGLTVFVIFLWALHKIPKDEPLEHWDANDEE